MACSRSRSTRTGRADIDSGGIGASINVQTLQPLAHPGTAASLTVKGLTSDNPGLGTILAKKTITPEISGAYQWTNDSGKFGVAAFGSYQEKTGSTRSDTVNHWTIEPFNDGSSNAFLTSGSYQAGVTTLNNAPTNPSQLVATPSDSRYTYAEDDTVRTNGEVVVTWRPTEELSITANSFYAETKEKEARSELTNWFSQSPYQALTFDGNTTIDSGRRRRRQGSDRQGPRLRKRTACGEHLHSVERLEAQVSPERSMDVHGRRVRVLFDLGRRQLERHHLDDRLGCPGICRHRHDHLRQPGGAGSECHA